ncbi:villin-1-like isoform X2 [Lineus longissimus]|uniref:villin-1-like isoform X2 n=1 Tax=Lineus longissimus TaxID=88925 RepID=UPI002B4D713A
MSDSNATDPAFRVITPGKANFMIWRVENFELKAIPQTNYGSFYKGDAYVVFSSGTSKTDMYVHFWVGEDCSLDEAGVAAFKAVECDDYVGGAATQRKETQNHESSQFLSYFREGLRYKDGGCASGFRHVDSEKFEPRLYRVKGKRYPRCTQMVIEWTSFNEGDSFVVDLGKLIFVWTGKESSRSETLKAMDFARKLRDDRGQQACPVVIESGQENSMTDDEKQLWEQFLPLSGRNIKSSSEAGEDEKFELKMTNQIKLYRCSDAGGTLTVTEAAVGPLKFEMLESKPKTGSMDVFIVDNCEAGVWVWVGRGASKTERRESMKNAMNFAKKKGYSANTSITRVVENGELSEFKMLFRNWPKPKYSGKTHTTGRIARSVQMKFDVGSMHENPSLASEFKMVDDGSGSVQIWRIEDFKKVPVDKKMFGQFFAGDSYIILYTYQVNNKDRHLIYYWLGRKATTDEKGSAALLTVELDDAYGGEPVQVRVVQGKEPPHFLAIFESKIIIFDGGKAGWSKEEKDQDIGESYLLRVAGTHKLNTKAVQVPLRASSLNSNDVFILKTKTALYIWSGKGCTGDEREMAKSAASCLTSRSPAINLEGHETEDFWKALGGREAYSNDKRLQEEKPEHPPVLYHCSNAKGYFSVERIPDFIQDDLVPEDVMILDTWDQVFIWIGDGANDEEKQKSKEVSVEYVESHPAGRDVDDVTFSTVKQGFEPPTFTGFFPTWDVNLWSGGKTYEELKAEFGQMKIGVQEVNANEVLNGSSDEGFYDVKKFSYAELSSGCPDGCRADQKEIYLTDEEFERVFKVSYSEFLTMQPWKQTQLKKRFKLF